MLKLWLVTCPDDFSSEYDDLEEMFKQGLTRLVLDKRGRGDNPRATVFDYERWLMSLPMEFRDRIWVRGTPDTAEQLEVRGCVCVARSFTGEVPESWKRVNCIALCQTLEEAQALPEWVAGALVGPIFQPASALEPVKTLGTCGSENMVNCGDTVPEGTKPEKNACTGGKDSTYGNQPAKRRVPLILWGGLDPETLPQVKHMNPSGVAVLGGIWNYADPINAFIKMNRACAQY